MCSISSYDFLLPIFSKVGMLFLSEQRLHFLVQIKIKFCQCRAVIFQLAMPVKPAHLLEMQILGPLKKL